MDHAPRDDAQTSALPMSDPAAPAGPADAADPAGPTAPADAGDPAGVSPAR